MAKLQKHILFVQFSLPFFGLFTLFCTGGLGTSHAQMQSNQGADLPEREQMEERLSEPTSPTAPTALKLTGYVDGTYLYNFGPGDATNPLDFPTDTIPKGDFNLSAVWLRLEKPISKSKSCEAGFTLGVMVGEDATYYAAVDSETNPQGPDSNGLYVAEAFARIWVPDIQMELWAGKFQSIIGYESIWRPDNPCITFGIADAFMPQDNTGVFAIFSPDPLFDIGMGVGNCSASSNDLSSSGGGDEYAVFQYFKIRNPKENAELQPGFYVTPSGTHGFNARFAFDQDFYYAWNVIGEWSPLFAEGNWKLSFDLTGGSGTGAPSTEPPEGPTTYFTTGLYSVWNILDPVALTGRFEYVHTNNNDLTHNTRLSGGDYYDYTLSLGVKITDELTWRGEGRFAWGAELMTSTTSALWTAATEIIYRF